MTDAARAVVLAGGDLPAAEALAGVITDRFADGATLVVAADSGLDHALALGLHVDVVVGDLDSASAEGQAAARAAGSEFETHPTDKDATDLELALLSARDRGARRVTVVGGGGGRHDHLLAAPDGSPSSAAGAAATTTSSPTPWSSRRRSWPTSSSTRSWAPPTSP
jgi:hypothetical protein